MADRRRIIMEAGLEVLREHGYAGLTQPRVARRAGLTQSLLTYYHPTRADLLAAVAQGAVERQLAALDAVFTSVTSTGQLVSLLAAVVARQENTRVLLALAQAGDEEPGLRVHFRDLADGIVERVGPVLERLGDQVEGEDAARLLHALSVGLAVVDLATARPDGSERAAAMLDFALGLIVGTGSAREIKEDER